MSQSRRIGRALRPAANPARSATCEEPPRASICARPSSPKITARAKPHTPSPPSLTASRNFSWYSSASSLAASVSFHPACASQIFPTVDCGPAASAFFRASSACFNNHSMILFMVSSFLFQHGDCAGALVFVSVQHRVPLLRGQLTQPRPAIGVNVPNDQLLIPTELAVGDKSHLHR